MSRLIPEKKGSPTARLSRSPSVQPKPSASTIAAKSPTTTSPKKAQGKKSLTPPTTTAPNTLASISEMTSAETTPSKKPKNSTSRGRSLSGKRSAETVGSTRSASRAASSYAIDYKSSRYESVLFQELPPCHAHHTHSSNYFLTNPLDKPKLTLHYHPPYRRNFRYFGYPQDLNKEILTPPHVKSWGSVTDLMPKSLQPKIKPLKTYRAVQDTGFDPHWMGRRLKKYLLLENPGLVAPIDKAAITLGSEDKLKLVHPDLQVTNCPSTLYFPITRQGRKAFCKINKFVQDKVDKHVRAYQVQNPQVMKMVKMEKEQLKDLENSGKEMENEMKHLHARRRKTLHQSTWKLPGRGKIANESAVTLEGVYGKEIGSLPPVIQTMCEEKNYPGMNLQLYEKPKPVEDGRYLLEMQEEELQLYGHATIPNFPSNIPEDVWQKLARVRQRQKELEKNMLAKLKMRDPDYGKFRTFTQGELRDEVLTLVRNDFMERLKENLDAELPKELFEDNRGKYQPHHDYWGTGQYPAQGPFWWLLDKEAGPTEQELKIVDQFIQEAKERHSFTHHLPGQMSTPKHPYAPFELDWMEKGVEMASVRVRRTTPEEMYDMPAYVMGLGREGVENQLEAMKKEGVKELVGKEMWDLYKQTYGVVEEKEGKEEEAEEDVVEKPKKRMRRKKKVEKLEEEEEEGEEEEEEWCGEEGDELCEEEGEDEEEDEDEEDNLPSWAKAVEEEPAEEYEARLEKELLEEEDFPLPNVKWDEILFPMNEIPTDLHPFMEKFNRNLIDAEPVKKEEEEALCSKDSDSDDSLTDSGEKVVENVDTEQPELEAEKEGDAPRASVAVTPKVSLSKEARKSAESKKEVRNSAESKKEVRNSAESKKGLEKAVKTGKSKSVSMKAGFSRDAVPELQAMYQSAMIKRKSQYHHVDQKDMEPPKLKDIFLMDSYMEDIEHLLNAEGSVRKLASL